MAVKVLALDASGAMTYCTAPPEMRGKGRCNHIAHMEDGETEAQFIERIESNEPTVQQKIKRSEEIFEEDGFKEGKGRIELYRMSEEEKEELVEVTGRNQLSEDIDGGYIHLDTPLWNDADKKHFCKEYGFKSSKMNEILNLTRYRVAASTVDEYPVGTEVAFTGKAADGELSNMKVFKQKYGNAVTFTGGVKLLNEIAAEKGFEATSDVYVLPYYMRQNPPAGPDGEPIYHPLNSQYNLLMIKRKNPDAQQVAYEQLVNNKNARVPLKRDGYVSPSLSTLLTGKPGVMRREMSGRSIGYTGRAVITPDMDLEFGELGVPPKILSKIYRPSIDKELGKAGWEKEDIEKWVNSLSGEQASIPQKSRVLLQDIMNNAGVRVISNRQPSLWYGSLTSFRPKVSQDQTIKVSPLYLENFAGDFDGDTFTLYGINDKDIAKDSETFSVEGIDGTRRPNRLDKSAIMPQKEAQWGLLNILYKRSS